MEVISRLKEQWKKVNWKWKIYFLSHSSPAVLKNAQSLSNYLSLDIQEKINSGEYPFEFNDPDLSYFSCVTSIKDIDFSQGCVVISSTDTLERGFSRKLFLDKANSDNLIIFTQREPPYSLAEALRTNNAHRTFRFIIKHREPLTGEELVKFMEKQSALQEKANEIEGDISDESDEVSQENIENSSQIAQSLKKHFFQFKRKETSDLSDYGANIVVENYLKGANPMAPSKMDTSKMIDSSLTQQNFIQELVYKPSKFMITQYDYNFVGTAVFWNLERTSDYSTIAYNVTSFNPTDIIIIGAKKENCEELMKILKGKSPQNTRIYIPAIGEKVSLQRDLTTRKISLSRALLSGIDFVNCGVNDIAYIEATLKADEHQQFVQARPVESSAGHQATFVGTIDMSQLSSKLDSLGINNDFKAGGVLECGRRRVKVRLVNEKSITVEGMICPDYIKVRNAIQDLLKMI